MFYVELNITKVMYIWFCVCELNIQVKDKDLLKADFNEHEQFLIFDI